MFVEIDHDGDEVSAVFEEFVVRIEHHPDAGEDGDQIGGRQGVDDGLLDARGDIGGLVEGVVGGEFEFDVDRVGKIGGKEPERDDASVDQTADEEQGGHEDADHGIARAEGEVEEVGVDFNGAGEHTIDGLAQFRVGKPGLAAQAAESARRILDHGGATVGHGTHRAEEVGQMRGQDEEGLQQGKAKRGDDDHGNDGEEFADDALAPDEGEKSGDGGADASEDRPHDFMRPTHGGRGRGFAGTVVAEGVLRRDNGVVDHHAEGHDHAKEGKHVDRKSAEVEHKKGAGEGKRDTEGDHQRDAPVEEEEENGRDEDERLDAVHGHCFDAGVDVFGGVPDNLRLDRWREGSGFRGENLARLVHGFDDVGAAFFHHGEGDGGAHIDTAVGLGLFRGLFDRGNVADFHRAAIGAATEGQVFKLRGIGDFPKQTDDTLAAGGVEASSDHIDIFRSDCIHHLGERQSGEA